MGMEVPGIWVCRRAFLAESLITTFQRMVAAGWRDNISVNVNYVLAALHGVGFPVFWRVDAMRLQVWVNERLGVSVACSCWA
jgi:hypothetical protein